MNTKSTQIVIIIGIIAVIGGAVYASLNLTKKQPGSSTTQTNSATNTSANNKNAVFLNLDSTLKGNATFTRPFFVPATNVFHATVTRNSADVTLITPAGIIINPDNAKTYGATYTANQANTQIIFSVTKPAAGTWQIQLTSTSDTAYPFSILIDGQASQAVSITTDKASYAAGEDITVTAKATDAGQPVMGVHWDIIYSQYAGFTTLNVLPIVVYDDGKNNDGAANDGVYGGKILGTGLQGKYRLEGDVLFPSGLSLNSVSYFDTPTPGKQSQVP